MILIFILLSSITLVIQNPLRDPDGQLIQITLYIDNSFTIIFVLEALFKIVTLGFIFNGKHSYIRNPWNVLDFLIVVFSVRFMFGSCVFRW